MISLKRLLFGCLTLAYIGACAQNVSNNRIKQLLVISDTIQLDSLSLIPGSIKLISKNNNVLDTAYYKINHTDGLLILNRKKLKENNIILDSLNVSYKTFPYLFSSELKHKNLEQIKPDFLNKNLFDYTITSKSDDIFKMEGLNKTGSISRGISFGNNQDVVVNSNLNLQLSGHLTNNIDILLAATDDNIPIQPDGNTQQLQEFDKVFIQLSNANTKLIAGDFQLYRPNGYFMNFNKKAQGLNFSTTVNTNKNSKDSTQQGIYKTTASAAVSRGKFARNQIQGIENNQGPYRLRGAENEPFIIVLSGTEKVYIDGKLMDRGQENDYIINYNTAEITFTAHQLITKDKRIVVEFQYSDRNYARSLFHFANEYQQNKMTAFVHFYSEQDSKNQPLQQELSSEQKQLLSNIGDTLSKAIVPSFESVEFNNDEVLYYKTDTTIGSQTFQQVFVYSPTKKYLTNGAIDSVHYRVTFSNVGAGKGHYNQISSAANGKVFEWVAPSGDTLFGSYEPIVQIITPKQKQMITGGIEYVFNKQTKLSVEGVFTKNDLNTFSLNNANDDIGYGLKMNFDNAKPLYSLNKKDTSKNYVMLLSNVNYEFIQRTFSPIERYRSIEFERDWNRGNTIIAANQHIIGTSIGLTKKNTGSVNYKFNSFLEGDSYTASRQHATIELLKKGFSLNYNGSLLNSKSASNSNFYRHKSRIAQTIKWIKIGLQDEFEQNKFSLKNKDSILSNSYQFWEWQAFAQNADTTKNKYGLNYKQRTDFATKNFLDITKLQKSTNGESVGGFFEWTKNPNNQLKLSSTYRELKIYDSTIALQKPDQSLVARIEYSFKLWKGFIYSNTFYEIGSGLEVKKEFSYIEVAAGQGVYTWKDYNNNDIKELNEFEIAVFSDQASYIKVFTPTNNYIKVYSNQFSEMLMIKPAVLWANKKGIKKFISRFSNQTSYRVDRKSTDNDLTKSYNPFLVKPDEKTLVALNSSFRNTLFINQMNPVFGLDISYQDIRNKVLLVNGVDSRSNKYEEGNLRWNIIQQLNFNLIYRNGMKTNTSEYFSTRNYIINYYEITPKLSYQPNTAFRLSVLFNYKNKKNDEDLGGQRAMIEDYGIELRYNILNKGSLELKGNFIQIKFDDSKNSSLAFEMLDALAPGQNITWGLIYQRNLSNNMQLNLTYDGRKSDAKIIHVGGAQIRAFF